jgi:hypothetical protein
VYQGSTIGASKSTQATKITSQARQIKNKAPQIAHIDTRKGTGSARHTAHTAGKDKRKGVTRARQQEEALSASSNG